MPQKLAIDWTLPLTVRRLMTLTGPLPETDIMAALDAVGHCASAGAEVQHLSGGEFQRALMARAIARKPDLLVLDEPVQGVDFAGEIALYELIKSIRNTTGCGILLISHDLHVVMAATDTVICLNGHVCCRGTPQAVTQSAEYVRLFGSRAAQALAVYSHTTTIRICRTAACCIRMDGDGSLPPRRRTPSWSECTTIGHNHVHDRGPCAPRSCGHAHHDRTAPIIAMSITGGRAPCLTISSFARSLRASGWR